MVKVILKDGYMPKDCLILTDEQYRLLDLLDTKGWLREEMEIEIYEGYDFEEV